MPRATHCTGRPQTSTRSQHAVDFDPAVAHTGPHDGGAGKLTDAHGGLEIREDAPEGITTKGRVASKAAERAGKARILRRYPS